MVSLIPLPPSILGFHDMLSHMVINVDNINLWVSQNVYSVADVSVESRELIWNNYSCEKHIPNVSCSVVTLCLSFKVLELCDEKHRVIPLLIMMMAHTTATLMSPWVARGVTSWWWLTLIPTVLSAAVFFMLTRWLQSICIHHVHYCLFLTVLQQNGIWLCAGSDLLIFP